MKADYLTDAAALLDTANPEATAALTGGKAAAFLKFLGLLEPDGSTALTPASRHQHARLLRAASALDDVFPMRVPTAPGAALLGARRTHCGGKGSEYAGEGMPEKTDYAGLGATLAEAFCRCIGEAAEHDAMFLRRKDKRLSNEGRLSFFDPKLQAAGHVDAALILREAGEGKPPPRTSTGYAAGPTLEHAALSALLECVERHAVALWFNGLRRPAPLLADPIVKSYCSALRGPEAPLVRFMRLAHDINGVEAAAAWSTLHAGRIAAGYGCALSVRQAAMKAARELCQGEFALHLEAQSAGPIQGAFTARSKMFATRPDLFSEGPALEEPARSTSSLAGLCARFPGQVRFVDLTLHADSVPVVCAVADGLRDIASERCAGESGPI